MLLCSRLLQNSLIPGRQYMYKQGRSLDLCRQAAWGRCALSAGPCKRRSRWGGLGRGGAGGGMSSQGGSELTYSDSGALEGAVGRLGGPCLAPAFSTLR